MRFELRELRKPLVPDSELPPFWQLRQAPDHLYFEGTEQAFHLLERLPEDGLGIVGTRRPQLRTQALVREVIRDLQDFPLIIVSGLARGIDAEAHEAALEFGLPTIAVLGTGLDQTYPEDHKGLRQRILAAGGLIASEFECGMGPEPWHFIQRNRLIAGWTKACWIAEAPHRSGALNTAKWAREQERATYATPCFPGDSALAGNEKLLDCYDARPVWSLRSFGETWPELNAVEPKRGKKFRDRKPFLESDERILAADVRARCLAAGGASVQETLDAALTRGWTPPRYFVALQAALRRGLILEKEGALASR